MMSSTILKRLPPICDQEGLDFAIKKLEKLKVEGLEDSYHSMLLVYEIENYIKFLRKLRKKTIEEVKND